MAEEESNKIGQFKKLVHKGMYIAIVIMSITLLYKFDKIKVNANSVQIFDNMAVFTWHFMYDAQAERKRINKKFAEQQEYAMDILSEK